MTVHGSDLAARVWSWMAVAACGMLMLYLVRTPVGVDSIDWGAIAPPVETPMHPWRWIVIHHSGWHSGDTTSIDAAHVHERGWDGIGYHFVIGNGSPMPRGRVDATWRWKQQYHGAHAGPAPEQEPFNADGVGICVIGNYNEDDLDPYVQQRLVELCALLIRHAPGLSTAHIIGHRDVPGKLTECPGKHLDINRLRFLVRERLLHDGGDLPR